MFSPPNRTAKCNMVQTLIFLVGMALLVANIFLAPWKLECSFGDATTFVSRVNLPLFNPPAEWGSPGARLQVSLDRPLYFTQTGTVLFALIISFHATRNRTTKQDPNKEFHLPFWYSHS
jgi:hypothetical protein